MGHMEDGGSRYTPCHAPWQGAYQLRKQQKSATPLTTPHIKGHIDSAITKKPPHPLPRPMARGVSIQDSAKVTTPCNTPHIEGCIDPPFATPHGKGRMAL